MRSNFELLLYYMSISFGYFYIVYLTWRFSQKNKDENLLLESDQDVDLDLCLNEDDYANQELSEERIKNLKCNITLDLMREPVIDKYGFSYEKNDIIDWIKKNGKCPMNRKVVNLENLRPNLALKNSIKYEILRVKYQRLFNSL